MVATSHRRQHNPVRLSVKANFGFVRWAEQRHCAAESSSAPQLRPRRGGMRFDFAQLLFWIAARRRVLKGYQQLCPVDVSHSAAPQVHALVVNDVADSEFHRAVHLGWSSD